MRNNLRKRSSCWKRAVAVLAVATALPGGAAFAQFHACGDPFRNHFGPFDYRSATAKQKLAVESVHYTVEIQQMKAGNTSVNLAGDLAYTLSVFPNHHGALKTMADWSIRTKRNPPKGTRYSVECWFDRGMRFRPDDEMVKLLYGIYLLQVGKTNEAVKHLEEARKSPRQDANLHYNLGLAYVRLGRYEDALDSAHRAYALGFPLPGLRRQLERAGKWREAPASASSEVGAALPKPTAEESAAAVPPASN